MPNPDLLFLIRVDGVVIAAFLTASDRDFCLGALCETYDDYVFEAADADK